MKNAILLILVIVSYACSPDPNQVYIDKVAEKVKQNDMDLDVGYRNIEFSWVDTIYDGNLIIGYEAENTYRMMVGTIDQKITATVIFDTDFNVVQIK